MLRLLFVLLTLLGLSLCPSVSFAQNDADWETYGEWQVRAVQDDMSPSSQIVIRTTVENESGDSFQYGFEVFGRSLVTQYVSYDFYAKNYWPHCDLDYSTYKIDEMGKPQYIATIDDGGSCDNVSLRVIRQFQNGQTARIKLKYTTGTISLKGFSAAWRRLQALAFE